MVVFEQSLIISLLIFQELLILTPGQPLGRDSHYACFLSYSHLFCAFSHRFLGSGTSVACMSFPSLVPCPCGSLPGTQCPALPAWETLRHASRASLRIRLSTCLPQLLPVGKRCKTYASTLLFITSESSSSPSLQLPQGCELNPGHL